MADAQTIIREIEAAYHHYIDVFNREDAAGFVGCYAHPHVMLSGQLGMVVTNTAENHQRGYQRMMETLHKSGWGHSGIDRLQIFPFSESLAQLVADVTRYKKDGSILEKLRASYMFRREDGGWKILAFGLVEAPFSGPGVER
jgi:ketosteroid isomerase-like protein